MAAGLSLSSISERSKDLEGSPLVVPVMGPDVQCFNKGCHKGAW